MSSDSFDDDDIDEGVEYEADEDQLERNPGEHGKWVSAVIALIGLWVFMAPFLMEVVAAHFWSDVFVGLALIALGSYNYYRRRDELLASEGAAALAALIGTWMIVAPFVFGGFEGFAEADLMFWNDVMGGLLVLALGAYSVYEARDTDVTAVAGT